MFTGCKNGNYNLSGKIDGLGNDTIYLFQPREAGNDLDTIIVKDGSFDYTLKVDTVTPFILLINDTEIPVFADKDLDVIIKGELSALNELQIRGGESNDALNEFRKSIASFKTSGSELKAKAEKYIRTHGNSPSSIYVLDNYFVQTENPDYKKISELIKSLSVDLQDEFYIKQLSEIAERQMNVEPGKQAPFFHNKDKDSTIISLNNFKDKYLLMTFWASWWYSSPKDQKAVKTITNKFKKEKLAFLGVSLDTNRDNWLNAIKKDTLAGIQVTDLQGWENSIALLYGIEKLPSNILIGPDGKIIARNLTEKDLAEKLEEIFK